LEPVGRSTIITCARSFLEPAPEAMRLLGGSSPGQTEVLVMGIGPLSKTPPRTSPAVNLEALRIGAAVEHIRAHGNLDGFPAGRGERLALVSIAAKQGLLVWNRSRARYELTSRGHRRVRTLGRAGRNALRDRQGGAVRSGMNAVVTAAGAVVVVGAAFLAFNPTGSTDLAPAREPGAYFTGGAPARASVQATRGMQAKAQPSAVTAAAITDATPVASEPISPPPPGGRVDAPGPNAGVRDGEAARSPAAAVPSESEIVSGAAQKSAGDDRDRPATNKLAHKQKKSGRRERNGDRERETVGPGYAYAPYGGAWRYPQWSGSPWGFR
jgi:hypothetical protein